MTTTTETFTETRKRHGRTFETLITIERTRLDAVPADVQQDRWFTEVGHAITEVYETKVWLQPMFGTGPEARREYADGSYIEIHTAFGVACVVRFKGFSEIQGYKGRGGARNLGTWRKHGSRRGHGMAWMRAMRCSSAKTACPAEVYARLVSADPEENPWEAADQRARARRREMREERAR